MRARTGISGKSMVRATHASSGRASSACDCSSYSAHIALIATFGSVISSMPTRSASSRDFLRGLSKKDPCAVSWRISGKFAPSANSCFRKVFVSCPTIATRDKISIASLLRNLATLPRSWLSQTLPPSDQITNSFAVISVSLAWSGTSFVSSKDLRLWL